jgi:MFS family permease
MRILDARREGNPKTGTDMTASQDLNANLGGSPRPSLTPLQWLVCFIAVIGFAFDTYSLLMAPLILPPAVREFAPAGMKPGSVEFRAFVGHWKGLMFFLPAFVGGIFGLLGGYLTDLLGRRRVLTWSILIYAVSAFLSGFATSIVMLLVLRCFTFLGVCVEFVAAIAWLAEMFPDPVMRERVLGYTQAFSSFGGLMIAGVNYLAIKESVSLPGLHVPSFLHGLFGDIPDPHRHEAWRYTLISGLIPAIPLIIIRPFLPESPVWAQKKAAGTLRRPSFAELFSPQLARTTIVTTIIFACSFGAAFGAIQQMPDVAKGLSDVKEKVARARAAVPAPSAAKPGPTTMPGESHVKLSFPASVPSVAQIIPTTKPAGEGKAAAPHGPDPRDLAQQKVEQEQASQYTGYQENGGLVGRFVLAILATYILSRRKLLRVFQVPGLIIVPLVFFYAATHNRPLFHLFGLDVTLFALGMFLAGLVTVAQFSFWGNYLPLVYPVHLRGTGESFAANVGGRMIGTSFAWVTTTIAATSLFPGDEPTRFAYTCGAVALFVYLLGFICSFFLPEPPKEAMPE